MDNPTAWWILAGFFAFYLLMLAVGAVVGALVVHAGLPMSWEQVAVAVVEGGAVIAIYLTVRVFGKRTAADVRHDSLDLDGTVDVSAWSSDGVALVRYQDSDWSARLLKRGPLQTGPHRIAGQDGNVLLIEPLPATQATSNAWRLVWTLLVLALYIGALALPAAAFITVDRDSHEFILRPWASIPDDDDVWIGFSMLFGGLIGLIVGEIGAAGWTANILFAIALLGFWGPPSCEGLTRLMSSLAIGLALVSLPLTNLAPFPEDMAGHKMAAIAPMAGYWLWLAAMVLLWVAIRAYPLGNPTWWGRSTPSE